MKLQNRLYLGVFLMAAAALAIGMLCLQASRGLFDNQAKVYNSGLAVFHLKKVSDAYGVDVIGAVEKVRNGAAWAWEDGGKAIAEAEKTADENWKDYMAMDKGKDEKYQASIVGALLDNNKHLMENLKNDFASKDARDLEIQATSVLYPSIDPILENIRKLEDLNEKVGQGAVDQAEKFFNNGFNLMAVSVAVLLLVGLGAGLSAANRALRPLASLVGEGEGNSGQVVRLSGQVSTAASQLNGLLLSEAAQLQKTGGSMEQALSMVQQNGQEAARSRHLLEDARSSLVASSEAAQKSVEQVRAMGQSVERIFQVVKTIEEIAFQTNILALNAGVEAVRAGEQGKEFVLVVEEIRNLSQRCSQVARETSKLITDNSRQASEGLRLSEEAVKSIFQTAEKAGKVGELLSIIEDGLDVQTQGLREVHTAVNNAERGAYRNSALGEKAAAAGGVLNREAESLRTHSQQLSDWVKGVVVSKPRQAPQVEPPAAAAQAQVPNKPVVAEKAAFLKDFQMGEKTGTDDSKVVPFK